MKKGATRSTVFGYLGGGVVVLLLVLLSLGTPMIGFKGFTSIDPPATSYYVEEYHCLGIIQKGAAPNFAAGPYQESCMGIPFGKTCRIETYYPGVPIADIKDTACR